MLVRVLNIVYRIVAHDRMLILAAKLFGSLTFACVSKLVAFDCELMTKTDDVANFMEECVPQVFALVGVRQGEVVAAEISDPIRKERTSNDVCVSVRGIGLIVNEDEVGLGAIGGVIDGNAKIDGVPFVCGSLEGLHSVFEISIAREAFADAKVSKLTTLAYSYGTRLNRVHIYRSLAGFAPVPLQRGMIGPEPITILWKPSFWATSALSALPHVPITPSWVRHS